jgi:hypothetical protein
LMTAQALDEKLARKARDDLAAPQEEANAA